MEKWKDKKYVKLIVFIIMILVLILIDFMMYSKFIYNDRTKYVNDFMEYDYALKDEEIKTENGKIEIIQTVTAKENNLEAISLGFNKDFRTYNQKTINIKIKDEETGEILSEYDNIYNTISKNYTEHKFKFKKIKNSYEKKYEIIVSYEDGLDDNALLYSEKEYDSGGLTINGEAKNGHVSFKLYYNSKYANIIFAIAMVVINLLAIIDFYIILYKNIKLEKIFLITVSVLGIIYLAIIPMYRGHDEHAHFFRAYEISQGILNTKIEHDESVTQIPAVFFDVMRNQNDERYINQGYYEDLRNSLNKEITDDNIWVNGSYMAVYSAIPYVPQAIAIRIASLFTNKVVAIFYVARLANLIFAVFILYIAFKILPYGKKLLFLICMVPTTLCQIASMSPDAMTFTFSVLFIAYVLKLINDNKELNNKNIARLTILGAVVGLCKITYIPIVFTVLLIPKRLYKKSRVKPLLIIILIPVIMNLIWLGIAGKHLALIDNNKSEVQKEFILSNPIEYIRICAYTLYSKWGMFMDGLFGQNLEHINYVQVGEMNVHLFIILFIFIVLFDDSMKDKIDNFGKITLGCILIIIVALIFTSLYMQWSGYKWYYIDGIQGRYFIELLLPLGLLLAQNNIAKNAKIDLKTTILCVACVANVMAILSCVISYI